MYVGSSVSSRHTFVYPTTVMVDDIDLYISSEKYFPFACASFCFISHGSALVVCYSHFLASHHWPET